MLTQGHMDLAASIQSVTEMIVRRLTRSLAAKSGMKKLCLAGGVALNCVANGVVLRDGQFDDIWIQPAAGDAGGALGAALAACHHHKGMPRVATNARDGMNGAYLGPSFTQDEIERSLTKAGAQYTRLEEPELLDATVEALAAEKAVGWFQGRMEFGPRALRARSILGDARSPTMQKTLNLKVKYRESFRPFAPSVMREYVADWFDLDTHSPYKKERQRSMTKDERALFGIDIYSAFRDPGGDACRLFRPDPNRSRRYQPALPRAVVALQSDDGLSGNREHELQRSRRAHRAHSRRRLPLLHGHGDRRSRHRQLLAPQGRPEPISSTTTSTRSRSTKASVAARGRRPENVKCSRTSPYGRSDRRRPFCSAKPPCGSPSSRTIS
jgi:hypothetical protein